jgi:hypothetical protein
MLLCALPPLQFKVKWGKKRWNIPLHAPFPIKLTHHLCTWCYAVPTSPCPAVSDSYTFLTLPQQHQLQTEVHVSKPYSLLQGWSLMYVKQCPIDIDMSYARRVPHPKVLHQRTASYSSHSVSHVLHQCTASHSSYILHLTLYTLYHIVFCTMWHVYALCVRHIHDPMLLP